MSLKARAGLNAGGLWTANPVHIQPAILGIESISAISIDARLSRSGTLNISTADYWTASVVSDLNTLWIAGVPPAKDVCQYKEFDGAKAAQVSSGGGSSDSHFEFTQSSASDSWLIDHQLNKRPSVTLLDSSGDLVLARITYLSANLVRITLSSPMSGIAYLN